MAEEPAAGGAHDNPRTEHEASDVNVRAVLGSAGGLVGLIVFTLVGMWWLWGWLSAREEATHPPLTGPAARERIRLPQDLDRIPEPRLQASEDRGLAALRQEEERLLTTYGWADRGAGAVRVPVERAIELVLKDGLPARRPGQPAGGGGK